MTCVKAQGFLAKQKVETREVVDAKQRRIGRAEGLALVRKAKELYAAKGKKAVHVVFAKEKLSNNDLAKLVIGPSGNLRAPAFFVNDTAVVGFDEATYRDLFR